MPFYALQLRAQMENITNLRPDGEDFRWYMKLKCGSCGEETEHHQYLTLTENQPLKGGRGHASLVIKCKLCSRENSIDIKPDTIKPYNIEDTNTFTSVVQFDCRGLEPIDFEPRMGWIASSTESRASFDDIDLTEKEWTDYDENGKCSVSIMELESKFIKIK